MRTKYLKFIMHLLSDIKLQHVSWYHIYYPRGGTLIESSVALWIFRTHLHSISMFENSQQRFSSLSVEVAKRIISTFLMCWCLILHVKHSMLMNGTNSFLLSSSSILLHSLSPAWKCFLNLLFTPFASNVITLYSFTSHYQLTWIVCESKQCCSPAAVVIHSRRNPQDALFLHGIIKCFWNWTCSDFPFLATNMLHFLFIIAHE